MFSQSVNVDVDKVFESFDEKEIREIIKIEAAKLGVAPCPINEILDRTMEYYGSYFIYITSMWKLWYNSYLQACTVWALNAIKNEIPEENELYLELEKKKKHNFCQVTKIIDMLSMEKIFPIDLYSSVTLHTVMKQMSPEQRNKVKGCILRLQKYCDVEGIKAILQSADVNVSKFRIMLVNNTSLPNQSDCFITRLEFMTSYIEQVAKVKYDHKTIGKKYWICSTGSDPHHEGQHTLFLVNKQNYKMCERHSRKKADKIAKVYKPHDLDADNAIVGKDGILAKLNDMLNTDGTILGGEKPFATMSIDVKKHMEEFVTKKDKMTQDEAKKYFFRAGMLKVITDAMAVIDLHQDNIMTTLNGPLVIDAEVDFFDYSSSNIERAFSHLNLSSEKSRPSTFQIVESDGEIVDSGRAWSIDTYSDMYREGYKFILNNIKPNIDRFADLYQMCLSDITDTCKIRILPFATSVFADYLQNGIALPKSEKNDYLSKDERINDRQGSASFIADRIEEVFVSCDKSISKPFIFGKENQELKIKLDKNKLTESIIKTFNDGTIIAMYCDMNGCVYLDDTIVGEILYKNKKVEKERLIKEMKENFKRVIRTLPNEV